MTDEVKDKGDIEDDRRRLTDVAIAIYLAHNPGLQDELVKTEAMPTETPRAARATALNTTAPPAGETTAPTIPSAKHPHQM